MSDFVRKGVNFNVDNAHQNELLAWVMAESANNFSGYVKTVLYATMVNKKAGLNSRLNETVNDSGDSAAGN